jgi:hypothetical protein
MSTVSNLIFHNAKHYVTSSFGPRDTISTAAGNTSNFHRGTDYGTNGKKLTQYAIEEGSVLSCGTAADGAKYVWVEYPRLGVKMLHYHLDAIKVKKGQKVTADTALGTTGKTGKSTGVHLHLGIKKLSGGDYIDPEKWSKNEYKAPSASSSAVVGASSATTTSKVKKAKDGAESFDKALAGTYKVTASSLNVRSGAGTGKAKLTTIPKGTKVQCYGWHTVLGSVKWLYVQFDYKGTTYIGFVSSKYVKK